MKKLNKEIAELKAEIKKSSTYLEYKKYQALIMEDGSLNAKMDELHMLSKRMVNDQEFHLDKQYQSDKKAYDKLKDELSKNVLVLLYFNAKEDLKYLFEDIFKTIGDQLDDIF